MQKSKTNNVNNIVISFIKIKAEEGFTFPLHEDLLLIAFLRPCKYDPKKTFKKMKKYYKFKIKHKKECENITVESVRHVFEENIIKFLPLRDQHGSRIVYLSCGSKLKTFK